MAEDQNAVAKRPKGRSPLYPSINLETAILRVRQLYAKERQHPTNVQAIVAHWNYKSLNGPAAQTLAALKKYGLIDDEGTGENRKAKISALAEVILAHPDEALRKAAIQEAALKPAMHRELWEKYHLDLPSDSNLRWELTHDRGFTETGASEFMRVYRATIGFAQLTSDAPGPAAGSDEDEPADDDLVLSAYNAPHPSGRSGPPPSLLRSTTSYRIPLISGGAVDLDGMFPLTEQDWDHFIRVLTAMKPGLVRDDAVATGAAPDRTAE
jgi:hypothetical protein